MIRFRGLDSLKLDKQNRITLPKKYKDQLTKFKKSKEYNEDEVRTFFVTRDLLPNRKCLNIYNFKNWIELENRILKKSGINDQNRYLATCIIGHSQEINLDKSCKFTVLANLIEFAELSKEIIFLGVSSHAEIWDKEVYKQYEQEQKQKQLLTEEFLNTLPN